MVITKKTNVVERTNSQAVQIGVEEKTKMPEFRKKRLRLMKMAMVKVPTGQDVLGLFLLCLG